MAGVFSYVAMRRVMRICRVADSAVLLVIFAVE